jgi:membrane protein YqaA with SNARE-associated domain
MTDSLLELLGLYGATLVIAFVAGMFPLISIEAFLVGYCTLRPVTWLEFVALVILAAIGHQISKTVCYFAGTSTLESRRVKPTIDKWRPRIDRWNKRPWVWFFFAASVGLPPMWLIGFVARPLMSLRFVPFTVVCFGCRAGRYAVLALIPMLAR